jgi:hypothetical protein
MACPAQLQPALADTAVRKAHVQLVQPSALQPVRSGRGNAGQEPHYLFPRAHDLCLSVLYDGHEPAWGTLAPRLCKVQCTYQSAAGTALVPRVGNARRDFAPENVTFSRSERVNDAVVQVRGAKSEPLPTVPVVDGVCWLFGLHLNRNIVDSSQPYHPGQHKEYNVR